MWTYLKAAFWHQEKLPIVGPVPVNLLAVIAFAALGFGHSVFWWVGGALEAAFLFMTCTSARFQKLVRALGKQGGDSNIELQLSTLLAKLSPTSKSRHDALASRLQRVRGIYLEAGNEYDLAPDHEHHLQHLSWLHLKLLLAGEHLNQDLAHTAEAQLKSQIVARQSELQSKATSPAAIASKQATLKILEERLSTAQRRNDRLEEIESDLQRIENQVELILEKATLHANPTEVSFTIDLASQSLDGDLLDSAETVRTLDRYFLER